MSECGHRAVLIITATVEGTTTNVALDRIELVCREPLGHEGDHRDAERGERWQGPPDRITTLLRDVNELPARAEPS